MTYRTYFDVYEAIVNHCIKTSRPLIEAIEDAEVLAALGLGADEKEAVEWVYMHAHVYWLVNKKTGEIRSASLEKLCAELGISTVRSEYEADIGMADWCDTLDQRIIGAIENSDWIDFRSYKEALDWAIENAPEQSEISLNNGLTYMSAEEAIGQILDNGLWEAVVNAMDDEIREEVHSELAPCAELTFLKRYLQLASDDLIVG